MQKDHRDADDDVGLCVKAVYRHPCKLCFISFLVAAFCSALSLQFMSLSNPLAGQRIRDHITAERSDAWLMAMLELRNQNEDVPKREATRTESYSPLNLIYSASYFHDLDGDQGNILTVANIQKIADFEDSILKGEEYENFCLKQKGTESCAPPQSAIPFLRSARTDQELRELVRRFLTTHKDGQLNDIERDAKWFFDAATSSRNITTSFALRSTIRFGLPLEGYLNRVDRSKEQLEAIKPYLKGVQTKALAFHRKLKQDGGMNGMQMFYWLEATLWDEILSILYSDLSCIVGSICCVFVILTLQTRSIFLGFMGLVQVLLAFPVCFFVYRVVLQIRLFGALQVISMFIILGIGADDIFILSDAYAQSKVIQHVKESKLQRLAYATKRAVETMLTTSVTSALAFGATMVSAVPAIKYFGVFTSCLVVVNFILCCTFYLSSLTIWLHYLEDLPWFWESSQADKGDDQAELGTIEMPKKSEGEGAFLSVVNPQHATKGEKLQVGKSNRRSTRSGRRASLVSSESLRNDSSRTIELIFHDHIGPCIVKFWKIILFVASILLVGMVITTGYLKVGEEDIYYPKDHRIARYLDLRTSAFTVSQRQSATYRIVWGIKGINRTGTDETDERDLGKVVYKEDFDFQSENAQMDMFQTCKDMNNQASRLGIKKKDFNEEVSDIKCFIAGFRVWRIGRNVSFPAPKEVFVEELMEFMRRPVGWKYHGQVGFFTQQKKIFIKFAWVEAKSTYNGYDESIGEKNNVLKAWEDFLSDHASDSLGKPYITGGRTDIFGFFMYTVSQLMFVNGAVWSVVISSLIAFLIVFIFTRNVLIALFSLVSILMIVFGVLGCTVILGGTLGSVRSVCITFLVGFSVDYTVHLAVAYVHSKKRTRQERVIDALSAMGVSVSAAAVSTFLSSCFLFFATFVFFLQFGTFMAIAVTWAYLCGTFVFMSLLAGFGPEPVSHETDPAKRKCCLVSIIPEQKSNGSSICQSVGKNKKLESTLKTSSCVGFIVFLLIFFPIMYSLEREKNIKTEDKKLKADELRYMPSSITDLKIDSWTELRPTGNTKCARGTPFAFFVKRGKSIEKIIVEFRGGGACWSKETCGLQTSTFSETAEGQRASFRDTPSKPPPKNDHPGDSKYTYPYRGIGDVDSHFEEYTHIYVPYCTGDLHWGNSVIQYTKSLKLHHYGAVNARSVLNWMYQSLPTAPKVVFVTGCSAGSYASLLWSTDIMKHYESIAAPTKVVQFGDSGMGTIRNLDLIVQVWNFSATLRGLELFSPNHEIYDNVYSNLTMPLLYKTAALKYPKHIFSQFAPSYDWNQALFLKRMKTKKPTFVINLEDKIAWNNEMKQLYQDFNFSSIPNYHEFIPEGDYHCAIAVNRYYTTSGYDKLEQSGTRIFLHQWVQRMIRNQTAPQSVGCKGEAACRRECDFMEVETQEKLPKNFFG